MSRRFKLGLILVGALVVAAAVFATFSDNQRPPVTPTPSTSAASVPTPSAVPESAEATVLRQLSTDLTVRYFSYDDPSSAEYQESIRPYLSERLFQEFRKAHEKGAGAPTVRSTVSATEVLSLSKVLATVSVELKTTEAGQTYEQRVRIEWQKRDGRWQAERIDLIGGNRPEDL